LISVSEQNFAEKPITYRDESQPVVGMIEKLVETLGSGRHSAILARDMNKNKIITEDSNSMIIKARLTGPQLTGQ